MWVFDTNALCDIYTYSESTQQQIIEFLTNNKSEILLPYQVYIEFKRHYQERRHRAKKMMKESKTEALKILKKIQEGYKSILKKFMRYDSELINIIDGQIKEFVKTQKSIEDEICLIEKGVDEIDDSTDQVLPFVEMLYKEQSPKDFTIIEKIKYAEECQLRSKYGFGPSKTDLGKTTQNVFSPYGDYLIWKSILNHVKNSSTDVIFITNEKKNDWWDDYSKKKPAKIILEDFQFVCPTKKFTMSNLVDFLLFYFDDQKEIADELNNKRYLNSKIRDYSNIEILINDNILSKCEYHLDECLLYDILAGENVSIGTISDISLSELDYQDSIIKSHEYDSSLGIYSLCAEITYKAKANCTLYVSKDYNEYGNIDFTIKQIVDIEYDVITELSKDNNIDDCFDLSDILFKKTIITIDDYQSNESLDYYDNICPNCGKPLTFENDALDGFCIKCSTEKL